MQHGVQVSMTLLITINVYVPPFYRNSEKSNCMAGVKETTELSVILHY